MLAKAEATESGDQRQYERPLRIASAIYLISSQPVASIVILTLKAFSRYYRWCSLG